ncbi:MAG: MBL fold metallo-hydrolase [Flavobacteriales bacterium]|jgi:phosphoribosyl 1,2-cyclic phosphate phosphodiesterase|nr:MBL fold metallo-hydrolase [Flavobacteriales bacterium]
MKVTFLGTGTSQGVPVIACSCGVCKSLDIKDQRLRSSVMISYGGRNYIIDSGPDFRQQMLRAKVQNIEAIVYTHEHKDHIAGMDDVRAFNFKHQKNMPLYVSDLVEKALKREFPYCFSENKYPGVPEIVLKNIQAASSFFLGEKEWIPIEVMHYKLPVLAFRIDDFAYITDANYISEKELKKLKGVKTLVINALRREEHISHFTLNQAIEKSREIGAERVYFTHISHLLGKHNEVLKELPEGFTLAYDGLEISV